MFRILMSVFIVLHGLVHMWYVTLSQGWVAFEPEMGWSGRSWLLGPLVGSAGARSLGSALYVVTTLAFVAGGVGLFSRATWARPLLTGAALLSSALIVAFWEGGLQMSVQKGLIGLSINVVLLVALWSARPAVAF